MFGLILFFLLLLDLYFKVFDLLLLVFLHYILMKIHLVTENHNLTVIEKGIFVFHREDFLQF